MQGQTVAFYDDGYYLRVEEPDVVRYIYKKGVSMEHNKNTGFYIQSNDYRAYFSLDAVLHPIVDSMAQLMETLRLWCAAAVPNLDASKITSGVFDSERIPGLDAGKITSGVLDAARLPGFIEAFSALGSLDAQSITTGTLSPDRIPGLDARKIVSGTLARELLPEIDASSIRIGSTLAPEVIPDLDASKITTGILLPQRIPALDAACIATGTLAVERLPVLSERHVPALDASKIATGVLAAERLPELALDAAHVVSGVLPDARIGPLDASKIVSGVFVSDRIPLLDASKLVSGTLSQDRVPSLDASKISAGLLSVSRIPSLDASKIGSGVLAPDRVPPLDTSKLSTGVLDAARMPSLAAMPGLLAVSQGGTGLSALPAGKLLVGGGPSAALTVPANLHWDAAASRLGIRTTAPADALHVAGNALLARVTASNVVLPCSSTPLSVTNAAVIYCDAADGLVKVITGPNLSAGAVLGPYFRNQTAYTYACTPATLVETTSSVTLVTKLTYTAPAMLEGTYRISVVYQGFTPLMSKSIRVLAFVDTPAKVLHDCTGMYTAGYNTVTHDFCAMPLAAGNHTFVVQYASPSGAQIGLSKAAIEVFYIGP